MFGKVYTNRNPRDLNSTTVARQVSTTPFDHGINQQCKSVTFWCRIFLAIPRTKKLLNSVHYLRQGGYVLVVVSTFLSVCQLATLCKNVRTDLHKIFREGRQWASEQMVKFSWRSVSRIRIRIATLVRRALAEVCTVPVFLVISIYGYRSLSERCAIAYRLMNEHDTVQAYTVYSTRPLFLKRG